MKKATIIIIISSLIILPLLITQNSDFMGTDDRAVTAIQEVDKNYKPWFNGIKLVESKEISSTFFGIQAAIGAAAIGYYVGYMRGKKTVIENKN